MQSTIHGVGLGCHGMASRAANAGYFLGLVLAGCQGFADQGEPILTAHGQSRGLKLTNLSITDYVGLSDLTHVELSDGSLRHFVIPERQRALVELKLADELGPTRLAHARAIVGIESGFDTESVTALGHEQFAIGTETMANKRPSDTIFIVGPEDANRPHQGALQVLQTLVMPYDLWPGFSARRNEGLEGLCASGEVILAASESTAKLPGYGRYAPIGAYNRQSGHWTPYALSLTMPTGRLSAVQCRISQDDSNHMEVLAIERHFGVARVLRAWMPLQPSVEGCQEPQVIFPEVLVDLGPMMTPMVNFEGIDWLANGDLILITDNHMGFVRGPSYLLRIPRG